MQKFESFAFKSLVVVSLFSGIIIAQESEKTKESEKQDPASEGVGFGKFKDISVSDLDLDLLKNKLVEATKASKKEGVYEYFLTLVLGHHILKPNGAASSFFQGTYNKATSGEPDSVSKGFNYRVYDKTSFLVSMLEAQFGVSEFEKQGKPRGEYGVTLTFIKTRDGKTYVTRNFQDWFNGVQSSRLYKVSKVELTEDGFLRILFPAQTLEYESTPRSDLLIMKLNDTLDSTYWRQVHKTDENVSSNLVIENEHAKMAEFTGGVLKTN